MHSIPLSIIKDIPVWANSRRKICRDIFCFCCSDVKYRSVRNGLVPPVSSHVVTFASETAVTYLNRITSPNCHYVQSGFYLLLVKHKSITTCCHLKYKWAAEVHWERFLVCCCDKLTPLPSPSPKDQWSKDWRMPSKSALLMSQIWDAFRDLECLSLEGSGNGYAADLQLPLSCAH